jgi:tetratricopeptide (TPR) repeat protein
MGRGRRKGNGEYVFSHVELGKRYLTEKKYDEALNVLRKALHYPANLGEGKLVGTAENHIYYYLGCAYEGLQNRVKAVECFSKASHGLEEPASAMFYNNQPPESIFYQGLAWTKLNSEKEAKRRFHKLIDYAEKHIFDDVKIDYFAVSLPDFLILMMTSINEMKFTVAS